MPNSIVLIGAGQIGSRHLQGLAKIDIPVTILVVDPNMASLKIAEARFNEVPPNPKIKQIKYITDLPITETNIDLLIVTTTANVRSSVTRNIIEKNKVKNILFEKVLFQKEYEYLEMKKILEHYDIHAWVNCPRRCFPSYKKIKENLNSKEPLVMTVQGMNWGLGCNAIHFIDLFSSFVNNNNYQLITNGLSTNILSSKRNGFYEVKGSLIGNYSNGNTIILCSQESMVPAYHLIMLQSPEISYWIDEYNKIVYSNENCKNWKMEQFEGLFQSEISQTIAKDILVYGTCELPTYESSMQLHLPLITGLKEHINTNGNLHLDYCPIT